jgi:NAD-dependent deacetylase
MDKKKLVVFTGSGISQESGIETFRGGENSTWGRYNVEDVATKDGWLRNRALVLEFYNKRHAQLKTVEPNNAHKILAELEKDFDVQIITQNVDDLHERAGSSNILHLHGELTKCRATGNGEVFDWYPDFELTTSTIAPDGSMLRPHIVWFGEDVPNMTKAVKIASEAEIFVVIGTSLQVYPAANLVNYVDVRVPIYVIDPGYVYADFPFKHIEKVATEGVEELREILINFN